VNLPASRLAIAKIADLRPAHASSGEYGRIPFFRCRLRQCPRIATAPKLLSKLPIVVRVGGGAGTKEVYQGACSFRYSLIMEWVTLAYLKGDSRPVVAGLSANCASESFLYARPDVARERRYGDLPNSRARCMLRGPSRWMRVRQVIEGGAVLRRSAPAVAWAGWLPAQDYIAPTSR
jgi:hypothetical protein